MQENCRYNIFVRGFGWAYKMRALYAAGGGDGVVGEGLINEFSL